MDVRHYAQELGVSFLSIQAQDFIEDIGLTGSGKGSAIPEHSSSGLH